MSDTPDDAGTTDRAETTATGAIAGTVTDADGNPVPDAFVIVAVSSDGSLAGSDETDDNGNYRVDGLAADDYDVTVEKVGFDPGRENDVTVTSGNTTRVDFTLSEAVRKVLGDIDYPYGIGMIARNTASSGWNYGLEAEVAPSSLFFDSAAVRARAKENAYGLDATTGSTRNFAAVRARTTATTGRARAIRAVSNSQGGEAIEARNDSSSGRHSVIYATVNSPDAVGITADSQASSGRGEAIRASVVDSGNLAINSQGPMKVRDVNTTSLRVTGTSTASDTSPTVEEHAAFIKGTETVDPALLAIKTAQASTLGGGVNFLTFYNGDDTAFGSIEGDGSGGVTINSGSADYAEYLPRLDPGESIDPGDVVGVIGGEVTKRTDDADRALVVSDRSIVAGNSPGQSPGARADYETVGFVGQIPTKVRGPVEEGDLVVPSGEGDGTGRAIPPEEWTPDGRAIVGRAWEGADGDGVSRVTVAVGIDDDAVVETALSAQRERIDELENAVELLTERVAALEGTDRPAPADD